VNTLTDDAVGEMVEVKIVLVISERIYGNGKRSSGFKTSTKYLKKHPLSISSPATRNPKKKKLLIG
jgi:hypothetical protein